MKEVARNFMVGVASIVSLVGLAALLLSFGEMESFFHPRYAVTINTTNTSGLRAGSTIVFNGVPIGIVDEVSAREDYQFPVKIVLKIDEDRRLPTDVTPVVAMPLIGGTATLQLRTAAAAPTTFLAMDGTAEFSAPMQGGMFADLTRQLDDRMKPLLESLARFDRLADTFVAVGDNLNNLMAPQTEQDIAGGAKPNIHTAVIRLNSVLTDAERGLELANSFLDDEQLAADARQSIHKAAELIDKATGAVDRYGELAHSLQANADEFTKRVLPVMDAMSATLDEVRRVTKLASEGQGTIGQLLNRPELYNSLNDSATRLDRTLVEMQLLIQQLRAEGFVIKF